MLVKDRKCANGKYTVLVMTMSQRSSRTVNAQNYQDCLLRSQKVLGSKVKSGKVMKLQRTKVIVPGQTTKLRNHNFTVRLDFRILVKSENKTQCV